MHRSLPFSACLPAGALVSTKQTERAGVAAFHAASGGHRRPRSSLVMRAGLRACRSWCSAFPRIAQWPGRSWPSLMEHPHRLTVAGAAQVDAVRRPHSLFPFSPANEGGNPNRIRMIRRFPAQFEPPAGLSALSVGRIAMAPGMDAADFARDRYEIGFESKESDMQMGRMEKPGTWAAR